MRLNGEDFSVVTCLFVDGTVLLAESEEDLQRVVNEFYNVCKRRKLQVNAGKSKVMVFERREGAMIDFQFQFNSFGCLLLGAPTRGWPQQKSFHLSLS